MPEQLRTDLFVWLYLSLLVFKNEEAGQDKTSYRNDEKGEAKRLIKKEFSSVIDEDTLGKIINNAEKDFVEGDRLSEETISFISTFDELFSSQVQIQHIFQDALTGDVLPCFNDLDYIRDCTLDGLLEVKPQTKRRPIKRQIKNALKIFNRLNKSNEPLSELMGADEDEFFDPDEEVDFSPDKKFEENNEQGKIPSDSKFNVVFLENSRCLVRLEVDIFVEDNKLVVSTPFDERTTFHWMNKHFSLARTSGRCSDLANFIDSLEQQYIVREKQNDSFAYKKDVAEQLDHLGPIYRLVLTTKNDDLKLILIKVDHYFTSKSESYFNQVGKYLECLLGPLINHSDKYTRQSYDYMSYCTELSVVCNSFNVKHNALMSKNIFDAWQKAWSHFKADMANVFLTNSKLQKCSYLYAEFIEELFDLYDIRNKGSHYKKNTKLYFDEADIEKLYRVTRVLIESY